jgi:hypothetical protein
VDDSNQLSVAAALWEDRGTPRERTIAANVRDGMGERAPGVTAEDPDIYRAVRRKALTVYSDQSYPVLDRHFYWRQKLLSALQISPEDRSGNPRSVDENSPGAEQRSVR